MKELNSFILTALIYLLILIKLPRVVVSTTFLRCMTTKHSAITTTVHARDSNMYSSLLLNAQHNPRWLNSSSTNKPLYIVTPSTETEIATTILCCKQQGLQVRVRSGGHDYEGLSYLSRTPFVLLDLMHLRAIKIDACDHTLWAQTGATLGELYYAVAKMTGGSYGFPAGTCPSVGLGGHVSGGGFGTLTRKYGLAADHVVDARLVDVNGRVLYRASMGEDLFWAIRGGGGASFGVITAWKMKMVSVPKVVTVFTVHKTPKDGASELVDRWQRILHTLPDDLFIRIIVQNVGYGVDKTVQVSFNSMFLGNIQSLIPLMKRSFPELGLEASDCTEMSWIDSIMYFAGHSRGKPREVLLDRAHQPYTNIYFKAKSDFVTRPIPETALRQAWERHLRVDTPFMIMEPFGGKMDSIPENKTPFPHRKGNLYNIQYMVKWKVNDVAEAKKHLRWIRMIYKFMTPYVSVGPRTAYLNYRDLDLGINGINGTKRYSDARVWGTRYFKNNFERLAKVKSRIDPGNFFRDEQSIPPFSQM